jgi:hypothetical protein
VAVATGAKGSSQDPWSRFCASGEISSVAAAKDVTSSVAQQLKHVSIFASWSLFFFYGFKFDSLLCQAAAFAEHIASGALTLEFAAEGRRLEGRIERLRT